MEYNLSVRENWLNWLSKYNRNGVPEFSDRVVVELGPGPDLGIGLLFLFDGVREYHAFDKFDLLHSGQEEYLKTLGRRFTGREIKVETSPVEHGMTVSVQGCEGRIFYIADAEFDLSSLGLLKFDFVFSQAAFEHFEDVEQVIKSISKLIKPGGILLSEIDLITHSRWLRDVDPLNIYRFGENIYRFLSVPGSPNRIRPSQYRHLLEVNGWKDIQIEPLERVPVSCYGSSPPVLSRPFRFEEPDMLFTSIMICARKALKGE